MTITNGRRINKCFKIDFFERLDLVSPNKKRENGIKRYGNHFAKPKWRSPMSNANQIKTPKKMIVSGYKYMSLDCRWLKEIWKKSFKLKITVFEIIIYSKKNAVNVMEKSAQVDNVASKVGLEYRMFAWKLLISPLNGRVKE